MQRIQTYLDNKTANALIQFAEEKELSISTAVGDILREHFERASNDNNSAMDLESKEYFLRILNTLNQVLMCVYDQDKVSLRSESAQACINKITKQIQGFLEQQSKISV